jgi:hypothetical protein
VIGGQPRFGVALLDPLTGSPAAWAPSLLSGVNATALTDGTIWMAGQFNVAEGESRRGIAAYVSPDLLDVVRSPRVATRLFARVVPNPSHDESALRLLLPAAARVTARLYDLAGRVVATPMQGVRVPSGAHELPLRTTALRPGLYLYRVTAGDETAEGRLIRLR